VAEVVRRCVSWALTEATPSREELYRRAMGLVGRFPDRDGARNLAADHDRYLDEAYR